MKENPTRSKSLEEATADFWETWTNRDKLDIKKKMKIHRYLRKQHGVKKERLIEWMMDEFGIERSIALNMINALLNQDAILITEEEPKYCFPVGD